ncbi:MAG: hypothetical protein ABSF34_21980 [Verrucomicrobiota bacterium]
MDFLSTAGLAEQGPGRKNVTGCLAAVGASRNHTQNQGAERSQMSEVEPTDDHQGAGGVAFRDALPTRSAPAWFHPPAGVTQVVSFDRAELREILNLPLLLTGISTRPFIRRSTSRY